MINLLILYMLKLRLREEVTLGFPQFAHLPNGTNHIYLVGLL